MTITSKPKKKKRRRAQPLKETHKHLWLPVVIRGKHFDAVTLAAKYYNVDISTVSEALDKGRLDYVGLGRGTGHKDRKLSGGKKAIPVKLGSVEFESINEAARVLKKDKKTIKRMQALYNKLTKGKQQ